MAGAGREAKSLGRHEAASVAAGPRGEPGRRPHVRLVKPQLRRGAHPGARPRLGCERGRGAGAQGRVGRRATCERLSPQTSRQEKQGHRAFSRAPTSGPGEGGALNCPAGVCPEAVSPTGTPGGTLHIGPPWALF